jgi:hypothetical protein
MECLFVWIEQLYKCFELLNLTSLGGIFSFIFLSTHTHSLFIYFTLTLTTQFSLSLSLSLSSLFSRLHSRNWIFDEICIHIFADIQILNLFVNWSINVVTLKFMVIVFQSLATKSSKRFVHQQVFRYIFSIRQNYNNYSLSFTYIHIHISFSHS